MLRPRDTRAIQAALMQSHGAVSIGGARYSMGGQIAVEDSLHIDMRGMNRLIRLDPGAKIVRVQAGRHAMA